MTRPNSGVLHPMREDRSAFEHVESPPNLWLVAACMGYALPLTSPLTIRICSWCDTAPQANALAKERDALLSLLHRFFHSGSSLGASHPHFAAYVSYPAALWDETKAVLDAASDRGEDAARQTKETT